MILPIFYRDFLKALLLVLPTACVATPDAGATAAAAAVLWLAVPVTAVMRLTLTICLTNLLNTS